MSSNVNNVEKLSLMGEVKYKECNDCKEFLPLDSFNFYKNKSSSDGYYPYCKICTKARSIKWRNENLEKAKENDKKKVKRNREKYKEHRKKFYMENKDKERRYLKNWQNQNKNKMYNYAIKKRKHEITIEEWIECLDYFNYTCAYCGMTEEEHYVKLGTQFHQEHVVHNGNNFIDNCVPSCKFCNSEKHDSEFKDWYIENNPKYSKRRLNKIVKWMTEISHTI